MQTGSLKKAFLQGALLTAMFFATWFVLSRVDWMTLFQVKYISEKTEEKLGELMRDFFEKTGTKVNDRDLLLSIDSLAAQICEGNGIDRGEVQIRVLGSGEVNAFALPGKYLYLYTGLIAQCANQEELCGVIAHELVHIRNGHVMKKLTKEMGLSVLIGMTSGNTGPGAVQETARLLSSTAFDRAMEREADEGAIRLLANAAIDPCPFADFLEELAKREPTGMSYLSWISTHPESSERANSVRESCNRYRTVYRPVLSPETWLRLKETCQELSN